MNVAEVCDSKDRDAWLRARRTGIGASEAAALVGEHAWLDLSRLVAIKRGLVDEPDAVERFEWGLRHEATIREAYASARYAGRETIAGGKLLRSTEHPWALATLDGMTLHPDHGWIPWEAKAIEVYKTDEWAHGPPPTYWWQQQYQMLVTGAPCNSIAALLGVHRLVWCDVDRDEAAIRRLTIRGAEVWALIQSGEEPQPPYDRETFRALWPREDGATIELDESFAVLDAEREDIAARLRTDGKRKDEIDAALRERIRGAERAVLPCGRVSYSLKAQTRKETVVAASTTRVLRRHEAKESR